MGAELFDVDGRMDGQPQRTNTRFSEMFEVPDIVHFIIYINHSQGTDLRLVELTGQNLTMA